MMYLIVVERTTIFRKQIVEKLHKINVAIWNIDTICNENANSIRRLLLHTYLVPRKPTTLFHNLNLLFKKIKFRHVIKCNVQIFIKKITIFY